jgi:hypothetical protein
MQFLETCIEFLERSLHSVQKEQSLLRIKIESLEAKIHKNENDIKDLCHSTGENRSHRWKFITAVSVGLITLLGTVITASIAVINNYIEIEFK